jgi:hypothetical protein
MSGLILLQKGVRGGAFIRPANSEALNQTLKDAVALKQLPRSKCVDAVRVIGRATIELACQRSRLVSNQTVGTARVHSESESPAFVDLLGQIGTLAENELLTVLMQSVGNILGPGTSEITVATNLQRSADKIFSAVARGDSGSAVARWDDYLAERFPEVGCGELEASLKKQKQMSGKETIAKPRAR